MTTGVDDDRGRRRRSQRASSRGKRRSHDGCFCDQQAKRARNTWEPHGHGVGEQTSQREKADARYPGGRNQRPDGQKVNPDQAGPRGFGPAHPLAHRKGWGAEHRRPKQSKQAAHNQPAGYRPNGKAASLLRVKKRSVGKAARTPSVIFGLCHFATKRPGRRSKPSGSLCCFMIFPAFPDCTQPHPLHDRR